MFLLEALFLSMTIAFLRKGKISNLAELNFKDPWLLLLALFLKFMVFLPLGTAYYNFVSTYSTPRHILLYFIILCFLLVNLRQAGFYLVFIGMLLNFVAIVANGGFMPAYSGSLQRAGLTDVALHLSIKGYWNNSILMSSQTRLNFLGDFFYLPFPAPFHSVFSIGDLIIAFGIFVFIQTVMLSPGHFIRSEARVVTGGNHEGL